MDALPINDLLRTSNMSFSGSAIIFSQLSWVSLNHIDLSHNALTGIDGTVPQFSQATPSLVTLNLGSNRLRSLSCIEHCLHLKELWTDNNDLGLGLVDRNGPVALEAVIAPLKTCPALRILMLQGNPCTRIAHRATSLTKETRESVGKRRKEVVNGILAAVQAAVNGVDATSVDEGASAGGASPCPLDLFLVSVIPSLHVVVTLEPIDFSHAERQRAVQGRSKRISGLPPTKSFTISRCSLVSISPSLALTAREWAQSDDAHGGRAWLQLVAEAETQSSEERSLLNVAKTSVLSGAEHALGDSKGGLVPPSRPVKTTVPSHVVRPRKWRPGVPEDMVQSRMYSHPSAPSASAITTENCDGAREVTLTTAVTDESVGNGIVVEERGVADSTPRPPDHKSIQPKIPGITQESRRKREHEAISAAVVMPGADGLPSKNDAGVELPLKNPGRRPDIEGARAKVPSRTAKPLLPHQKWNSGALAGGLASTESGVSEGLTGAESKAEQVGTRATSNPGRKPDIDGAKAKVPGRTAPPLQSHQKWTMEASNSAPATEAVSVNARPARGSNPARKPDIAGAKAIVPSRNIDRKSHDVALSKPIPEVGHLLG